MSTYPLPEELKELPKEAVYHSIPEYSDYIVSVGRTIMIVPFEHLEIRDYIRGVIVFRNPGPGPAEISLPGNGKLHVVYGMVQFIINDDQGLRTGTASESDNSIININPNEPVIGTAERRTEIFQAELTERRQQSFNNTLQQGLNVIDQFLAQVDSASQINPIRPPHENVGAPRSLQLQNNNTTAEICKLFGSYTNRTLANLGNRNGINVLSNIPGVNYQMQLARSENRPIQFNEIQLIVVTGPWRHFITTPVLLKNRDVASDRETTDVIWFTSGPPGSDENTLYAKCPGKHIDGYTEFEFLIPPSSTISVIFNSIAPIPAQEKPDKRNKFARQIIKLKRRK